MKYLFFGGSFNPICNHHLLMAQYAAEDGVYDYVVFLPAYNPPHKDELISFEHRYEMVRLAIGKNTRFRVRDIEKTIYDAFMSPSYTIDTVRFLQKEYGLDKVHLLIGGDSLANLSSWHKYEELKSIVKFIVIPRTNSAACYTRVSQSIDMKLVNCPMGDLSSTFVRQRYADLRDNRYFVPKKVNKYIKKHRLYEEWEK